LIHADKHGFLIIPEEDQAGILQASLFMDNNECETVINAALAFDRVEEQIQIAEKMNESAHSFNEAALANSDKKGEWK